MNVYRFDVENRRTATLWVEADNEEDALTDAGFLAEELEAGDWEDGETDVTPMGIQTPTGHVAIWTGGADGHYRLNEVSE